MPRVSTPQWYATSAKEIAMVTLDFVKGSEMQETDIKGPRLDVR